MVLRPETEDLIEVVGFKEENCINCHQCIAVCPVKVCSDGSGDVVKFNNHLCIGCGRCIEACINSHGGATEKSARFPLDDAEDFIKDLPHKNIVALVAPSAGGNFALPKLITALRRLGVAAVYDVSLGAEITVDCYHKLLESGEIKPPLIAQPCPAIVNYIELLYPYLISHLAPTGSPVHDLALYVKSLHPDSKLAFISPCLAKRREFQDSGAVRYNVIYQSLSNMFTARNIDLADLEDGTFDHSVQAGKAANFSTPGGLKEAYLHRYPDTAPSSITRVEGSMVYEKYLPQLERAIRKGYSNLPMIIDILSCEHGCNMGSGCINHFKPVHSVEQPIALRLEKILHDDAMTASRQVFLDEVVKKHDFSYTSYQDLSSRFELSIPSAEELDEIFKKMHKTEEKDFRNCAACGYNSCYFMAIAIHNGLNKGENCHLYQEKELLYEQAMLSNMVAKLEVLNQELQQEFSERKQQEQILVQNSKLAAMGEMIGMIAHQWRQPLSSISTVAGNLQVYIDLDMYEKDQFMTMLGEINNHAQYLSNTINDFRHFFKPDNPQDEVLLHEVIDSTMGIIGKSLEYKNVCVINDCKFQNPILTYPNELMQVFLNILKNASDAFVENEILAPQILIKGYEEHPYHIVEISDNAGGIMAEVIDKIFDPYFSTKGPGIGTGLGLYMSKMIVEEHCRGQLLVRNEDEGACFVIKLPIAI
ncbi:MAG: [Fe-Fe] hydrogenase large subunit C-terminal domain-containing protein [Deltaproteobacteria bacterium]